MLLSLPRTSVDAAQLEVDRNGLEVLDRPECLRLLGLATIGRIGITSGALPVILPVNFRVIDERVIIRTGVGTKLDAAARNAVVAFEVDAIDAVSHSGWSVVVTGVASEVTDPGRIARYLATGVARWAPRGEARLIELSTEMIRGRRLAPALHLPA